MRVFVTGATGFIGRQVVAVLAGHDVMALVGDLNDPAPWKQAVIDFAPDVCIHLAWEGLPDYSEVACFRNEYLTTRLYELMRWPRFVGIGTCFEYGNSNSCVKEEGDAADEMDHFVACKARLRFVGSQHADQFLWVRPFYVYGPGQRPTSLLPSVYAAFKADKIPDVRNPDAVCDFIHVEDVAEGIVRLATGTAPGGVYNLGSGQPWRVRDAVNQIAQQTGKEQTFYPCVNNTTAANGIWADMTKTTAATGWKPSVSLADGIRCTVEEWEKTP